MRRPGIADSPTSDVSVVERAPPQWYPVTEPSCLRLASARVSTYIHTHTHRRTESQDQPRCHIVPVLCVQSGDHIPMSDRHGTGPLGSLGYTWFISGASRVSSRPACTCFFANDFLILALNSGFEYACLDFTFSPVVSSRSMLMAAVLCQVRSCQQLLAHFALSK
jgi:hypothetical protein